MRLEGFNKLILVVISTTFMKVVKILQKSKLYLSLSIHKFLSPSIVICITLQIISCISDMNNKTK